eukprot:12812698-Alexandrium_andersonii.AAC.1
MLPARCVSKLPHDVRPRSAHVVDVAQDAVARGLHAVQGENTGTRCALNSSALAAPAHVRNLAARHVRAGL